MFRIRREYSAFVVFCLGFFSVWGGRGPNKLCFWYVPHNQCSPIYAVVFSIIHPRYTVCAFLFGFVPNKLRFWFVAHIQSSNPEFGRFCMFVPNNWDKVIKHDNLHLSHQKYHKQQKCNSYIVWVSWSSILVKKMFI